MYTRSAVLAPPTYAGLGRSQHGPNVISVHVTVYYSPALPFPGHYISLATTFLQRPAVLTTDILVLVVERRGLMKWSLEFPPDSNKTHLTDFQRIINSKGTMI
jgi:hypothetical protein